MHTQRRTFLVVAVLGVVLGGLPSAVAQAAPRETAKAADEDLDKAASTPEGEQRVRDGLATEFNVEGSRIDALREQDLGYGEINHTLSIAEQMPGGITDDNVNQITQMREEHKGWGQISQEVLGAKLGPTIRSDSAGTAPRSQERPGTSGTQRATDKSSHSTGVSRPGGNTQRSFHGGPSGNRSSTPGGWSHGSGTGRGGGSNAHGVGHGR